jgi:hypothetical protein
VLAPRRSRALTSSSSFLAGLLQRVTSRSAITDAATANSSVPPPPPAHPLSGQAWRVRVVGHSLGAGVAALLALHLRAALPHNDVW